MFIHFLLTTVIAAAMYAGGEQAGAPRSCSAAGWAATWGDGGPPGRPGDPQRGARRGGDRLRPERCGRHRAGGGRRSFAPMLTALMFVLCLVQIGPGLVLVPAVIWMYYSGDTLWASVLLVFTIIAATMDQFIRPVLIRRGADLPMMLILAGVIGGLIAFGILGFLLAPRFWRSPIRC